MKMPRRAAPALIASASLLLGVLGSACQRAPERSVADVRGPSPRAEVAEGGGGRRRR